jgi:AcrR family transcriptional regulator
MDLSPTTEPVNPTEVSTSRRERRARETRRKILVAAFELFSERGIEAVTVEEIAERADVARATVFNYFASKETLCTELGELQVEALREAVEEGRISGPSVSEKLAQALRVSSEFPGTSPENCRLMLLRSLGSLRPGELPEHRKHFFEMLDAWVKEGQASGELRSDRPSCELAAFLMGLQFHATLLWAFGYTAGSLADQQVRVLQLALEGIRDRGAA